MYTTEFNGIMFNELKNATNCYLGVTQEAEAVRVELKKTSQRIALLKQLLNIDDPGMESKNS